MKLIDWLRSRVKQGSSPAFSEEENRKAVVVNLFAIIGSFITGALGIRAYIASDYPLAASLLITAALCFVIRLTMVIGRSTRAHRFAAALMVSSLMILMIYLVITGGKANTGPIWLLVVPPVTLFLNGIRKGLIMLAVFLSIIVYLFVWSDIALIEQVYSLEFKKRIVYVFITVTFLSSVYEYSRQQTYAEIQRLRKKFERQATYDPLTQLLNRRGLQKQIVAELARSDRQSSVASVILLDLDKFKQVNDTYGHDAGDDVLTNTADLLRRSIRQQDYVSRWGGEEFLLVLPDTNQQNAQVLAEKIREKIANATIAFEQHTLKVTASFGVSEVTSSDNFEKAISLADKALYQAKNNGRNKVVMAESS